MHPLLNIAIDAAKRAGNHIAKQSQRLEHITVIEKATNDFVSEVDVQSETLIIETIRKAYPHHHILAEESGHCAREHSDVPTWIIDPLDGTTNFIHGFPFYGVSIAVQEKGIIQHGVIYEPVRNELYTASRGQGARLNDTRIRVKQQNQFGKTLIGTGFPYLHKEKLNNYFESFNAIFNECAGLRRSGAAAIDLAYVAAGRLDGFWEFQLHPWDIAAGSLLIKEAGGLVCDETGGENYLSTGNIVAGNVKTLKSLLKLINSHYK